MIHVLIERHIAEGMLSTYEENSKRILHRSYAAPGFISGEAFSDIDDPNHRYVLCKWRSNHDWAQWAGSDIRSELMKLISPMLTEPEKITMLRN